MGGGAADRPRTAGAEGVSNKTVMCALCRSTHSGGGVALFVARRAGAAGRNDNTVGTYICADLACSMYARLPAATASACPAPGISNTTNE